MALYDFLYKNDSIVKSFYSQLYDGLIREHSKTDTVSSEDRETITVGPKVLAQGILDGTKGISNQKTSIVEPYDLLTVDVLSYLSSISKDIGDSANGDIVKVSGNLFILDKNLIEVITGNASSFLPQQSKEEKKVFSAFSSFLKSVRMEPLAVIKSSENTVTGTIREEFMSETIASFQMRLGSDGLDNVTILGIREVAENKTNFQNASNLYESARLMALGIHDMIIPNDSIKLTPIAIFRQINI